MSFDTVDLLHDAEDRIGALTAELSSLIAAVDSQVTPAKIDLADTDALGFILERARQVLAYGYCRCDIEDVGDPPHPVCVGEDCGCPCGAHADDEAPPTVFCFVCGAPAGDRVYGYDVCAEHVEALTREAADAIDKLAQVAQAYARIEEGP